MNKKFSLPRGTADISPDEIGQWQVLESKARSVLGCWGYHEIRTPLFEETELFARSMGQTSDIVQKQMLTLASQKAEDEAVVSLSLRPEGTAAIVRSYIQNDLDRKESLSKLYYLGPMFRGERPQKGRLRQFHQIGAEAIGPGSALPLLDAEMIALSIELLRQFGLNDDQFKLKLNTLGSTADKENFSQFLRQQLQAQKAQLCEDCQNRYDRNVFRILDCKNRTCRSIVTGLKLDHSYLTSESRTYFQDVLKSLDALGIAYRVIYDLVRGLDYYTHTVFEISCENLGSQDAVGAGGRYSGLIEQLGGPSVDAIGFALGMERVLLALAQSSPGPKPLDVFLISMDETCLHKNFVLARQIRQLGYSADLTYKLASMKSQMRLADKLRARYVIILGGDELAKGVVTLKNMASGDQQQVGFADIHKMIEIVK